MPDQANVPAAELPPSTDAPISALSRTGLRWRIAVTGCIIALLAYGTFFGHDDDWPFGPLRQYASSTRVSSQVLLTHVYGVHPDGTVVRINTEALGLRVAELDGQLPRLRKQPELLLSLATAYHRTYPDREPLVRLILQRDGKRTRNRKVIREIHRVEATVDVP